MCLSCGQFCPVDAKWGAMPAYGDDCARRDYTYVDDVIWGVLSAMDYSESQHETTNLGKNKTMVSLLDMVRSLLEEVLG